jgi:hypothetical protein
MVVIADSDFIRKLAYCCFLGEFLQLVQVPPNDIWVLPALPFQVRKKLGTCPEALADFEKFFKKTKFVPKANVDMLVRFENLDGGEQQIFALLCEIKRVELVVTGDKKAINKVAALVHKDPSLGELMGSSAIWCFETIVLRLMQKQGFSITNARMKRWRQRQGLAMDDAMAEIFAAGCTEQSVTSELKNRIDSLRASCIGLPVQF